jgi:hypothetical protein
MVTRAGVASEVTFVLKFTFFDDLPFVHMTD